MEGGEEMKRIIHMSDLHVGFEDHGDRFRLIIANLIKEKGDKPENYVIVITGDLVNNANDILRYDEVKTCFDQLKQNGFKHLLVIPGNHDYGTGDKGDPKFVRLFKSCFFGKEILYPKLDIIDNMAFIGLDSMAEELHWYDDLFAQGELGEAQLKRLTSLLKQEDVKKSIKKIVYLHHHPFAPRPFHELRDANKLKEIIAGKVDAILYGHNHQGYAHHGQWEIKRCYDAGTATLKPRPKWLKWMPWFTVKASTRVIDLNYETPNVDYTLNLL